jgi:hypothetical protein
MKTGRPSAYTPELADKICLLLSEGASLLQICKADDMPTRQTVHNWLLADRVFFDKYACAREMQADALADEIIEISDNSAFDMTVDDDTGRAIVDHEHIQRSRLRVDARKWYAAKVAPKKYGDRVIQNHVGADDGAIQTEDVTAHDTRERIASRIAGLVHGGTAKPDTE